MKEKKDEDQVNEGNNHWRQQHMNFKSPDTYNTSLIKEKTRMIAFFSFLVIGYREKCGLEK